MPIARAQKSRAQTRLAWNRAPACPLLLLPTSCAPTSHGVVISAQSKLFLPAPCCCAARRPQLTSGAMVHGRREESDRDNGAKDQICGHIDLRWGTEQEPGRLTSQPRSLPSIVRSKSTESRIQRCWSRKNRIAQISRGFSARFAPTFRPASTPTNPRGSDDIPLFPIFISSGLDDQSPNG